MAQPAASGTKAANASTPARERLIRCFLSFTLALHDLSTDFTLLHKTASTSGLRGTPFGSRHSAASAFLRHGAVSFH
jgi:hypothetical protein